MRGFDPPAGCHGTGAAGCGWVVLSWNRRVLASSLARERASRRHSQCAVCCFRWIGEWGVLVPVIGIAGLFVGLRQRRPPATPASDARQRRPPATPASDARQRRGDARPRASPATPASDAATRPTPQAMPGFVPLGPVNNHGTTGTHFGRIHRETPPPSCGVLERFLLPASFAVLQSPRPTSTSEPSELPVSDEFSMKVTNVTAIDDGSVATHTP